MVEYYSAKYSAFFQLFGRSRISEKRPVFGRSRHSVQPYSYLILLIFAEWQPRGSPAPRQLVDVTLPINVVNRCPCRRRCRRCDVSCVALQQWPQSPSAGRLRFLLPAHHRNSVASLRRRSDVIAALHVSGDTWLFEVSLSRRRVYSVLVWCPRLVK